MANSEQHFFDGLVPVKSFFSIGEVSQVLGLSRQTVLNACEEGVLISHAFSGGTGARMTRRIPRAGIILFLLQNKTYRPADFMDGVLGLLAKMSAGDLRSVRDQLPRMIEQADAKLAPPNRDTLVAKGAKRTSK